MKDKTKSWGLVAVFVVISVSVVLVLSFAAGSSQTSPNPSSSSSPSPSVSAVGGSAEAIAEASAGGFMSTVMVGVTEQLGEEKANAVFVNVNTAAEDSSGKPAKVAIIYLTEVPAELDVDKSIASLREAVDEANVAGSGSKWELVEAEEGSFEESSGVVSAVKIFDAADDPDNPAIIEISYVVNPDSGLYEISISATVY